MKVLWNIGQFKIKRKTRFDIIIRVEWIFEKKDCWILLYWNSFQSSNLTKTLELYFSIIPTIPLKVSIIKDLLKVY